jgi:hypothetical protein
MYYVDIFIIVLRFDLIFFSYIIKIRRRRRRKRNNIINVQQHNTTKIKIENIIVNHDLSYY